MRTPACSSRNSTTAKFANSDARISHTEEQQTTRMGWMNALAGQSTRAVSMVTLLTVVVCVGEVQEGCAVHPCTVGVEVGGGAGECRGLLDPQPTARVEIVLLGLRRVTTSSPFDHRMIVHRMQCTHQVLHTQQHTSTHKTNPTLVSHQLTHPRSCASACSVTQCSIG